MTPEMHARMQGIDTDAERRALLILSLRTLVPLWVEQARGWTTEQRSARANEVSGVIAGGEHCDELRGRHGHGPAWFANGSPTGDGGVILNSLALGLALLAFLPGGITYLDTHWEAT